jgi:hypothetical protein
MTDAMTKTVVRVNWVPVVLWTALAMAPGAEARPRSGPVVIEHSSIPAGLKPGSEVTTTFTFRALGDFDQLEVSVSPFMGIRVISEPSRAVFTNVKSGEVRQLQVTVRIMDSKIASLGVSYRATVGDRTFPDVITVDYI